MQVQEINANSPLRILESSTRGALGPGNLGVIMARAGVGKTAFLVQVGIDEALRDRKVIHIALGQSLDHVHSWYDALLDHVVGADQADDLARLRKKVGGNLLIQAYPQTGIGSEKIAELVRLYSKSLGFEPAAILIDGYTWESANKKPEQTVEHEVAELKVLANHLGAELWLTAQTRRAVTTDHPTSITPPCDAVADLIDLAVYLEPEGRHVSVRLLKDHDNPSPADTHLQLHTDTLQLAPEDGEDGRPVRPPASAFMLLSGGAKGSETAFGEAAERWGMGETHFTFAGRQPPRTRGLVVLSEEELERGSVSEAYIKAQLHRSFPKTETFQRILKSIWHIIATAGEVFVIGRIRKDGTVKGGTGWGVELARHFDKRLYVYDQERDGWFRWKNDDWQPEEAPVIRSPRFAGTGTRFPTDAAVAAINDLFERSFAAGRNAN